jgi:uncharacterized protein
MEILPGIEIIDSGLFIKEKKILIVGDMHIGYEECLRENGFLVPKFNFGEMKKRAGKIIDLIDVKKIIINGDLKHEFGKINKDEWSKIKDMIDFIRKKGKVILIKGNHDVLLDKIAKKKSMKIKDYIKTGDILITHGNKIPSLLKKKNHIKTIIISHEHPAVVLKHGIRKEKFRCFLKGKWKNKNLLVIPAFNLLFPGSDLLEGRFLSPFLKESGLKNFNFYIAENKFNSVYDFGKLEDSDIV